MCNVTRVGSDSGDPMNERYPQCPVPSSPAQPPLWVHLSHTRCSSFPAALFSQHYCLFQRTLSSQDVPKVGQLHFCHFCLQRSFRLTFVFLAVQVSIELSPPTQYFKWIRYFLSAFFPVQISHLYIVIGNMRVWRILALVSSDTSLFLGIFPNPPIAALQVSTFFWFLLCSLHLNWSLNQSKQNI